MTTLLYRGNEYVQQNKAAETSPVQLTYRRNVYQGRLNEAAPNVALIGVQLTLTAFLVHAEIGGSTHSQRLWCWGLRPSTNDWFGLSRSDSPRNLAVALQASMACSGFKHTSRKIAGKLWLVAKLFSVKIVLMNSSTTQEAQA